MVVLPSRGAGALNPSGPCERYSFAGSNPSGTRQATVSARQRDRAFSVFHPPNAQVLRSTYPASPMRGSVTHEAHWDGGNQATRKSACFAGDHDLGWGTL